MDIQGVYVGNSQSQELNNSPTKKVEKEKSTSKTQDTVAATYEPSNETTSKKVTYKQDTKTIAKLKEEADRRTASLRNLVEKMMLKQGHAYDETTMYQMLREGNLEVDEETRLNAQADISEDGYWGVKQTSDRLVSFAMALTGGDPSKADEMIGAIMQGFNEATKAWGSELPDICKRTLDATMEKLDAWKNSIHTDK